jgi:hypothetical protein
MNRIKMLVNELADMRSAGRSQAKYGPACYCVPLWRSPMSYQKMVLSHLSQVLQLPEAIQADIAKRVSNSIQLVKAAKDEALLSVCAMAANEEQAKAIGQGATTMDPRWAAPALAEAWCYAKLSLSKGYLDRSDALAIIESIEAFTAKHSSRQPSNTTDTRSAAAAQSKSVV